MSNQEKHTQAYTFTNLLSRHRHPDWGDLGFVCSGLILRTCDPQLYTYTYCRLSPMSHTHNFPVSTVGQGTFWLGRELNLWPHFSFTPDMMAQWSKALKLNYCCHRRDPKVVSLIPGLDKLLNQSYYLVLASTMVSLFKCEGLLVAAIVA